MSIGRGRTNGKRGERNGKEERRLQKVGQQLQVTDKILECRTEGGIMGRLGSKSGR